MVSFRTVLLLIANVGDSLVAHCGEVQRALSQAMSLIRFETGNPFVGL